MTRAYSEVIFQLINDNPLGSLLFLIDSYLLGEVFISDT